MVLSRVAFLGQYMFTLVLCLNAEVYKMSEDIYIL